MKSKTLQTIPKVVASHTVNLSKLMEINEYQRAPRLADGTFSNYAHWDFKMKTFSDIWQWQSSRVDNSKIPRESAVLDEVLPVRKPDFESLLEPGKAKLTWLGHSTTLLQVAGGFNVLTDPIFSDRCSPVSFAGPKRYRPSPIKSIQELPEINAVCISHNHYDHMDYQSIQDIAQAFPNAVFYMPLGNSTYLPSIISPDRIVELDWWQDAKLGDFEISLLPAQHWSKRGLFDSNKALWGSFLVKGKGGSYWFAGDTGYCSVFKAIGLRYGGFSCASIPIGAFEPRDFMKQQHINGAEAVTIHREVLSRHSLGIHWGTFQLTDEYYLEPRDLKELEKNDDPFSVINHGDSILVDWDLGKR